MKNEKTIKKCPDNYRDVIEKMNNTKPAFNCVAKVRVFSECYN